MVGTKCDLYPERQVPREVAVGLSKAWGGVPYYETSARKEINVVEVFEDVMRQMVKVGAGRETEKGKKGKGKCVVV